MDIVLGILALIALGASLGCIIFWFERSWYYERWMETAEELGHADERLMAYQRYCGPLPEDPEP